jgi:ATP-dependent DNA helicase PIF1
MEINALGIQNVNSWLNDSNFDHIKYIAIGAIVMLTKNINISKAIVNGAIAIITSIEFDNNKIIINITIKIHNSNTFIKLKIQTLQHKYTYKAYYYKTSFPIVQAYAITSYKAQGATIKSKVILDIKNSFALTYVMLSRVINHSDLMIRGNLKPLDFKCIYQY